MELVCFCACVFYLYCIVMLSSFYCFLLLLQSICVSLVSYAHQSCITCPTHVFILLVQHILFILLCQNKSLYYSPKHALYIPQLNVYSTFQKTRYCSTWFKPCFIYSVNICLYYCSNHVCILLVQNTFCHLFSKTYLYIP